MKTVTASKRNCSGMRWSAKNVGHG